MGGKSRKSGGVSKKLIDKLKSQSECAPGDKNCGIKPKKSRANFGIISK
jgi:hypothetical protein